MGLADGVPSFPAALAARFAAALLVGALLIRLSRPGAFRLRWWGGAWIALAVQVAGSGFDTPRGQGIVTFLGFFAGALAFSIGTYGYLAGLLLGTYAGSEPGARSILVRRALTVGFSLSLITLAGLAVSPPGSPFAVALHHGAPQMARAASCLAVAFRLGQHRPRFASGSWLVMLGLVLQGGQAAIGLAARLSGSAPPLGGALSTVMAGGLVGVGMIACLLDDEHEETVRASAEVLRASAVDALTGLSNKAAFVHETEKRLSNRSSFGDGLSVSEGRGIGEGIGIVFLALNRLGGINHSLGHAAGDRILRTTAERLRASLRDGDEVGRVGGDEFAVLVGSLSRREDVVSVAHKLEEVIRRPFEVDGRELSVTASVGVSVYPEDAGDAPTLLDQACTAAHRVKDRVGGRVGVYAKGMNDGALERLSLEHDLSRAIERDELVLYFQPVFSLPCLTIRGYEALIRWRHPRFGLIGADLIISLAESTGLIHTIAPWAMRVACATVQAQRGARNDALTLSLNVSAHQLMGADLVDHVGAALEESGLPGTHLEVELTETAAIDNVRTAREHLDRLRRMGVSIAIDDFGTGYSSLAYLRNLPLDTIKIDRSFIRDIAVDLSDGALVTTIIALAQGRDLDVVAEGVETEEQLKFLVSRGCDYAQGYLLSRPLPPEELETHDFRRCPMSSDGRTDD